MQTSAFKKSLPEVLTLSDDAYEHFLEGWKNAIGLLSKEEAIFSADTFSQRVKPRHPNNMLELMDLLSDALLQPLQQPGKADFPLGVFAQFVSILLQDLSQLATEQVASLSVNFKFTVADQEKAHAAKAIILRDFEQYHTVEQLARKVGTTEAKLQQAFQYTFQMTVAQFSRQARLKEAYRLLTETDYPLRVICVMVGYDDPGNFAVAFKTQYGYNPGFVNKHRKK